MKKLSVLLSALFIFITAEAQSKDERQIRTVMNEQTMAWNEGNMLRYMNTYWKSDSLMFISKSGVEYGWANILKNYQKFYPDSVSMGTLDFELINLKRLSVMCYSVVGKWHLKRTAGDQKGSFTLVFKKIKKRWVIVQDHSS